MNKTTMYSLVTGGAGFIGSHVVDELISLGHNVIVLDDLSGGFRRNVNPKAKFIKGSILDIKLLAEIFNDYKIQYIFHLAAYAAEGLSHFIRRFNYENNLIGSINLLNLAILHNVEHFVFTSSIAVYGANQTPMREDLTPRPEDPYGISKYAFELDLQAANTMFGLSYTIFRPHNVYGERQNHGDPYRNVLGIFINNSMLGKPMTIFGDGTQTRAFSYISDVAPYIARSVSVNAAKNTIINIGADKPYSILELAETIAKALGKKKEIKFLPARHEVVDAHSDHSRAKEIFSIKKTTPLYEGIERMVKWSLGVGPISPKPFKNVEVLKNLPPSWKRLIS